MSRKTLPPPLLDEATAAFIQSSVSINASSRTAENVPVTARGAGCRVSKDRRTVTLLFSAPGSEALLESVRVTGQIATVFSRPSTHQTIQLKGKDAVAVPLPRGHIALAQRHREALIAEVTPLGFPEAVTRALLWFDPSDLTAVTFAPTEAFHQTPGPRAGEPLKRQC
jgi:hypothetical protein